MVKTEVASPATSEATQDAPRHPLLTEHLSPDAHEKLKQAYAEAQRREAEANPQPDAEVPPFDTADIDLDLESGPLLPPVVEKADAPKQPEAEPEPKKREKSAVQLGKKLLEKVSAPVDAKPAPPEKAQEQKHPERPQGKTHTDVHDHPHTPVSPRPPESRKSPHSHKNRTEHAAPGSGEKNETATKPKAEQSMEDMSPAEITRIIERATNILEQAIAILNRKIAQEQGETSAVDSQPSAITPEAPITEPEKHLTVKDASEAPTDVHVTVDTEGKDPFHIMRTKNGRFIDMQPKGNKPGRPFTTERAYKEQFIGPHDHVEDYDYHITNQSTAYYDKLNNIDNQGEVYESPRYDTMSITELVREAGKVKYSNPGNEPKGIVEPDLQAIRDAARAEYTRKAQASGEANIDQAVEKEMSLFNGMVDRYVRLRLIEDTEKTEAGRDTIKAQFKRWWSGMQHRFGVHHWDTLWSREPKEAPALNSGVSEDLPPEDQERKKVANRHNILLGRTALLAKLFKQPRQGGATAQTWRVHAAELARDFPDDFKFDKYGDLQRTKEDGSLSEAAAERYKQITELGYRK